MKKLLFILAFASLVTGCASVKMEPHENSDLKKQFLQPKAGHAALYTYRDSFMGRALKKDMWVDGKCIGESAPDVFFYTELPGNQSYVISTESEFSPNKLSLFAKTGENYFIQQYIKPGIFVGGADLELMTNEQGKSAVTKLKLATSGNCSE